MKNYLKPTLVFAAASVGSTSSCFAPEDLKIIVDALGAGYDADKIFGADEPCLTPIFSEYYCKYTSVESGKAQGFLS